MHPMFILTGVYLVKVLSSPLARQNAYLDPGSGSFLIQLLIAAAAGLAFALRGYWSKIINIFRKSGDGEAENADEPSQDE